MNNKELKKLSRKDLLEIILAQTNRIEDLETENRKLTTELNSKKIDIESSGSLAEAVVKLSGIFDLAQKTADEYVSLIKVNTKKQETKMKKELEKEKNKIIKRTMKECDKKKQEADNYMKDVEIKVKNFIESNNANITIGVRKTKRKKQTV